MAEHVLIPVDGSAATRRVLEEAVRWPAAIRPPRVTLLVLWKPDSGVRLGLRLSEERDMPTPTTDVQVLLERGWGGGESQDAAGLADAALGVLTRADYDEESLDVAWASRTPDSAVARKIVGEARARDCDLIVLARADGPADERAAGPVTEEAVRRASEGGIEILLVE